MDYNEPWTLKECHAFRGKEPFYLPHTDTEKLIQMSLKVNAERIVACINACRDVPSEDLEEMIMIGVSSKYLGETNPPDWCVKLFQEYKELERRKWLDKKGQG